MTHSDRTRTPPTIPPVAARRTLRTIAVFEAFKGLAAFAAMIGVLDLMHHNVRHLAIELIGYFGMNPHGHYPALILRYADLLPNANVHALVLLAIGYIALRLLESYGLWNARTWAEWLGALSGGLYIPLEINHLMHRFSVINVAVLAGNIFVVCFLLFQLWQRRAKKAICP